MAQAEIGAESIRGRVRRLSELWRAALARSPHPAGCQCMGLFLIPAMNPADLENDIVDLLRERYLSEGLTDLVDLLDQRLAEHDGGAPPSFRTWLLGLPERHVAGGALNRLVTDLEATLASCGGTDRQGGARSSSFVCY